MTHSLTFASKNRFLLSAIALTVCVLIGTVLFSYKFAHAQCQGDGYVAGSDGFGNITCTDPGGGQTDPAQVVLTANPATIQQGDSSLLSWGSDNSTSNYPYDVCTLDNGIGDVAVTGSRSVTPGTTTTYHITCTHTTQISVPCGNTNCFSTGVISSSANATVTVTPNPTLIASCSVTPTSLVVPNSATWTATASGGSGSYTYSWTGTDGLTGSTASVSKNYTTAGTKTGSVTVTSGAQSVTQACGSGVVASNATSPDLSAGSISPTSATAGTPVTLSSSVSNTGDASTGAGFIDLFQRATDSSGTGSADIGTYSSAALAVSGSNTASLSYTFPSAGTWYVRACADKSSGADTGSIAESNEGNNCGAWTAITVAVAVLPTLSCSVNPSAVTIPGSATYTATGASAPYTWTAPDGGSYGTANTASRNFTVAGSYGMTVSKGGYTSGNCPVVTAGTAATCSGTAATITATPDRIHANDPITITYTASNVNTSCTITGPGISPSQVIPAASCSIPANGGSISIPANTITTQTTYTITCDGITQQTVVNVLPKFQEF